MCLVPWVLALFSLLVGAANAQDGRSVAEGTPVTEVVIEGVERTSPDHIRAVMELKPGEPYSRSAVRRDIDAISALGDYNSVEISPVAPPSGQTGLRLTVSVVENPVVASISIVGNVTYPTERLLRELDFEEGAIYPLGGRLLTSRSLESFYAKGGFKNAQVRVTTEPADDPGTLNVFIAIDEGEKIKIRDLKVEGNEHFSDWRIGTWVMNSGSWLLFNNYYDDRAFEDDLRTVEMRYRDAGFLDVRARRGEFESNREEAWVNPAIRVEEGPRYRIAGVEVSGVTLFTQTEVNAPFRPLIGKIYNGDRFRRAVGELRALYGDQGYVNAEFKGDFEKNAELAEVILKIGVDENDVVYIGDVYVLTQSYDYQFDLNAFEKFIDWTSPGVKRETIEREVVFEPGQKYRTVDEVRTVENLRELGFLTDIRIRRDPTAEPQVEDVVVEVEEDQSAGYIGLTAGVGEKSGPAIGLSYVNPNLFGDAKVVRANALIGNRTLGLYAGYLNRRFLDTDNSFELEGYYDRSRYRGYEETIIGGATEFGREIRNDWKGYLRLRLENVDLKRKDDDLAEDMSTYQVAALRGRVIRDRRDDPRWTTKGYVVAGSLESGYARGFLLKAEHRFEWYQALSRDENWVYAYGHMAGLQPYHASHVGISERFFLGGTTTLRGFDPRGIGPTDEGTDDVHVGGSTYVTQRHEIRRRLNDVLRVRGFADAGMMGEDALQFGSPRVGTGGGIQLDAGAFVIEVDLGYAAVRQEHDRTRILHFRLKSNF